jgi:hypothetical protein
MSATLLPGSIDPGSFPLRDAAAVSGMLWIVSIVIIDLALTKHMKQFFNRLGIILVVVGNYRTHSEHAPSRPSVVSSCDDRDEVDNA